ncbi:MAG: TraR/DksA family transcriptional regulator [Pseudomonadota bacterium]
MLKDKKEKADIKKMKKLLLQKKEELEKEDPAKKAPVSEHENSNFADANDLATHDTDLANDLNVKQLKDQQYGQILDALQRIEDGEYGLCEECGVEIGAKRLEVYPVSRLCIGCQEEYERVQKAKALVSSANKNSQDKSSE